MSMAFSMKIRLSTRDRIITELRRSGRSRGWLARASGISAGTISEYLGGKIDTVTEKADRMLHALLRQS